MSRVDAILDLLDVGIQTSAERGYPEHHLIDGRCARCCMNAAQDGDMCSDCRAFLLGDSDTDPRSQVDEDIYIPATVWFNAILDHTYTFGPSAPPERFYFPIVTVPRGGITWTNPA